MHIEMLRPLGSGIFIRSVPVVKFIFLTVIRITLPPMFAMLHGLVGVNHAIVNIATAATKLIALWASMAHFTASIASSTN